MCASLVMKTKPYQREEKQQQQTTTNKKTTASTTYVCSWLMDIVDTVHRVHYSFSQFDLVHIFSGPFPTQYLCRVTPYRSCQFLLGNRNSWESGVNRACVAIVT